MTMTIISAQQPFFLPNFYFFQKIFQSDVFLIADHLRFRKQSPIVRALLSKKAKTKYLTVPIIHSANPHPHLPEVQIYPEQNWKRKHLKTLLSLYSKEPYFEYYFPFLKTIYERDYKYLLPFLQDLLQMHFHIFSPKTIIHSALKLDITDDEKFIQWIKKYENPILLIHKNEYSYYSKHFPDLSVKKINQVDIRLPEEFYPEMPFIILLFKKGPEIHNYIKNEKIEL